MAQKLVISFSQNLKSLYFFVWNYGTMTTVNCCYWVLLKILFLPKLGTKKVEMGPRKATLCSLDFPDFFACKVIRHRCSKVLCNDVYRRFPLAQNRGKLTQIKRKWSIRSYSQNASVSFLNFCEAKYIRS